mgnify:CR=1 FL=1
MPKQIRRLWVHLYINGWCPTNSMVIVLFITIDKNTTPFYTYPTPINWWLLLHVLVWSSSSRITFNHVRRNITLQKILKPRENNMFFKAWKDGEREILYYAMDIPKHIKTLEFPKTYLWMIYRSYEWTWT